MLGIIRCGESGTHAEEMRLGGTRFLCLTMRRSRFPHSPGAKWRADRAARELWERGVRRAVYPEGFPFEAVFAERGVREVDPMPLRRALGGPYICRRMERLGFLPGGTLGISGESLRPELKDAVLYAVPRCRYVLLDVPRGGEELAGEIRREWGAAVQLRPSAEQMERAEGLLLFDPREDLSLQNPALCTAYPGGALLPEIRLPDTLAKIMPDGYAQSQLAAALWYSGNAHLEDFLVEFIG